MVIGPSILLAHQDEDNFPQAQEFRPERFVKGSTEKVVPNTWIPFGGGVRRCIGAGFSLVEATEILRAALRRYDVRAVQAEPEPARPRNVTLVPARGCEVLVSPRHS